MSSQSEHATKVALRRVEAEIARNAGLRSATERRRELPWGIIRNTKRAATISTSARWEVDVSGSREDGFDLQIGPGLVNGVEPLVGEQPVSKRPTLHFDITAFDANDRAGLYLEAVLTPGYFLQRVDVRVIPPYPAAKPFTAWKLLGFIFLGKNSLTYEPQCFLNLGLGTVFDRKANGIARYVWYAA